jgi:hypothetical protein
MTVSGMADDAETPRERGYFASSQNELAWSP